MVSDHPPAMVSTSVEITKRRMAVLKSSKQQFIEEPGPS
jgi:hypothetical protein